MTIRILHVLDHSVPLHSGYTFRTRNILREQRARGWVTSHVTGPKQGQTHWDKETVGDLDFYRTQPESAKWSDRPVLDQWGVVTALTRRIVEVAKIERPDVLHAHSPALNGMAALRASRELKLPVVYECRAFWEDAAVDHGTATEWGLRYRATRALESRVFRRANAITTICEGLRDEIGGRMRVSRDKITVIPNAVNVEDFEFKPPVHQETVERLKLKDCTVLGFIGSFYAYEGIPFLIDTLPALREAMPDLRLLLVGGGPDEKNIRQRIRKHRLDDMVVMTGRVSHDEVQRFYSVVDTFVYPRLPMRLTDLVTPLKPLEAMAQGRLVVASDVGGHRELIRDGDTGRLFQAGDKGALVRAVTDLLSNRDDWERMRDAGRHFVEQERTWADSVARYEKVYGSVL